MKVKVVFVFVMFFIAISVSVFAQEPDEEIEIEVWDFDSVEQFDVWRIEHGMTRSPHAVIELEAVDDCSFEDIEIDPATAGPLSVNSSVLEAHMSYCSKTHRFLLTFGSDYAGHDYREIRMDASIRGVNEAGIPKHHRAWNATYTPEEDGALVVHHVIDSEANGQMYHFVLEISLIDTVTQQGPIVDYSWWLLQEKYWVYHPVTVNLQGISCPHIFHQSGDRPVDGGISVGTGPDRALRFWILDPDRRWSAATVEVYEYLQGQVPRELLHENIQCESGICESSPIIGTPADPQPRAGAQLIVTFQLYPDSIGSNCSKTVYADPPMDQTSSDFFQMTNTRQSLAINLHEYEFRNED